MSKKYWYVIGIGIIAVFMVFIFFNRKNVVIKEKAKIERLIQKNKNSEVLDLIVKTFIKERPDYESLQKLGEHLISLSVKEIDEIFSSALTKYPQYTDELNISWAWVLSSKGKYEQALDKIEEDVVLDSFWDSVKQDILDECKMQ